MIKLYEIPGFGFGLSKDDKQFYWATSAQLAHAYIWPNDRDIAKIDDKTAKFLIWSCE